ncbi:MAG: ABC transporter permease [Pseudomonadota bacterium]
MSGSFERRGPPPPPSADTVAERRRSASAQADAAAPALDPVLDPVLRMPTTPASARSAPEQITYTPDLATPRTEPPREFVAAPPPAHDEDAPAAAPIVPAASITGRSLTLVIAIMCFFACLTAGAVYMMNKSASGWLRNLASEVTVQIEPAQNPADADRLVGEVIDWLRRQRGVVGASPIAASESRALLEPWLGETEALSELPIPRLIAIQLNQTQDVDTERLRQGLKTRFPTASLDDHRQWQSQIRTMTRSFALGGLAILLLVGAATTAIIISATRSAMLSNREIVEVLHFVGATDRFIAREFEKNFLRLGIRAGLVGAFAAALVFLAMPTLMELLGGGSLTLAEIKRLFGTGSLDAMGFLLLGIVVIVVAGLCMMTSRFGVYRILNAK